MHFSSTALKDAIMVTNSMNMNDSMNDSMNNSSNNNNDQHCWMANQQQFATTANRDAFVQRVLETNYDQLKRETSMAIDQQPANKRFKMSE
mmetsp:Transcript_2961/g.4816  ORF Transcript_2961/g.4816 Transcript_2961/m.4816 type:complete len:91 (-) Transcript_2961:278-550(-)|eukprot:CAMPEP_0119004336 /NCGR_PEP_ID=MMETSP1176-20130426/1086_1 /TAXON_ID=265551 /ORGANISM="Synedropsis recta cf, Strain CCMP1620" /LENGTH=90 /DNA_ID=CAMNT_0006956027 /DNA_START=114 /DNA_END=386 /DNA_ORIENTATION=-